MTFFSPLAVYNFRKEAVSLETVVYADLLFFINFLIDGLCLSVSALVLGRGLRLPRLAAGAALGGLYAVFAVWLPVDNPLFLVPLHLLAAFLICLAAFGRQSAKADAANTLCFFVVSALLGGIIYAVYSVCGRYAYYGGAFYAELSAPALIAGACAASTIAAVCLIKAKTRAVSKYADLILTFRGKECVLHCLCDSGNLLVCPYTALPVAVIGLNAAKKLFSGEELDALKETPAMKDVRPLPASGIGGSALLPSFVPEEARTKAFGNGKYKNVRLCVAIRLTNDDFGGSDGILPPCLL